MSTTNDPLGAVVRGLLDDLTERGAEYLTRTAKDSLAAALRLHEMKTRTSEKFAWRYRTGRDVPFNLYRQLGAEPAKTDPSIGYVRTAQDANELVTAANEGLKTMREIDESVTELKTAARALVTALETQSPQGVSPLELLARTKLIEELEKTGG